MKTKAIILLAVSAIITLSFSFVSVNSIEKKTVKTEIKPDLSREPAGGFVTDAK